MVKIPVSEETRTAVEELLVTARRTHMSSDDVADRLEMVSYFHRDLLRDDARRWVTSLFSTQLSKVEATHRDLSQREKMLVAATRVESALVEAVETIKMLQNRTRSLSYSVHEDVPLAQSLQDPLVCATLPKLGGLLGRHGNSLAKAEIHLLESQGSDREDVCRLLGLTGLQVDGLVASDRRTGEDRRAGNDRRTRVR